MVVEPVSNENLFLQIGGAGAGDGPGTMRDPEDTMDYGLQTGGMFYVAIVDDDGEPWDGDADIQLLMDPYSLEEIDDAGDVNSYSLNEDGMWSQADSLSDPADGAEIEPEFPGWTNCDRSVPLACIKGTVSVTGGGACEGGRLSSNSAGFASADSSGGKGQFCLDGGSGKTISVSMGGAVVYSGTLGSTPGNCTREETCEDVGQIEVDDSDVCAEEGPIPPSEDPTSDDSVSPGCADMIEQAHDMFDDMYSGDACSTSCAHAYYDCLAANDCSDYSGCISQLTSCVEGCT